jgi:hypothetical protein
MYIIKNQDGVQYLNKLITSASDVQPAIILGSHTSAPSEQVAGSLYYDSTVGKVRVSKGGTYTDLSPYSPVEVYNASGGVELQSNSSATITAQTDTAGYTFLNHNIIQSGRLATGNVRFADFKVDGSSVFYIDESGIANYTTSHLGSFGPNSLISKEYADNISKNLDTKESVNLATQVALAANTAAGSGENKTLTANANGALSIDGVAAIQGWRVLIKNETASENNGIYVVTQVGDGSNPWILTRSDDADSDTQVSNGLFTFVEQGTILASTGWRLQTSDPITVDTTGLDFTQFSGTGVQGSWIDNGIFSGASGIEIQNLATTDLSGQTSNAGFTGLDWDIDVSGRSSSGSIDFLNLKRNSTSVFSISDDGDINAPNQTSFWKTSGNTTINSNTSLNISGAGTVLDLYAVNGDELSGIYLGNANSGSLAGGDFPLTTIIESFDGNSVGFYNKDTSGSDSFNYTVGPKGFKYNQSVSSVIATVEVTMGLNGLEFAGSSFSNSSYVTKTYVDDAITTNTFSLTDGNGTTANGSAVDLGGTITSTSITIVDGSAGNVYYSIGTDLNSATIKQSFLSANAITGNDDNYTGIETYDPSFANAVSLLGPTSRFAIESFGYTLSITDANYYPRLAVFDNRLANKRGLQLLGYGETDEQGTSADYSGLAGTSLVPKKYVDDEITSATSGSIEVDKFVYAASNTFTLTSTPAAILLVTLQGIALTEVSDYSLTGSDITLNDTLTVDDEINVIYTSSVNLGLSADYYTKTESDANARVQQALVQRTGTVIAFDRPASYGDVTAETGNITFDFTNAISGTTQVLKHNSGTKPTMPASANRLSGDYFLSIDNQIYLTPIFISGSTWRVDVTVSQNNTW